MAAITRPSCRCSRPGAGASAPHLTWSDQPFKSGEGTFIEIAGCYRRYHCPLSRTVFLGKPPQKFLDTRESRRRRPRGRAGSRQARQYLREGGSRLAQDRRPLWHREGKPHRLSHRTQLSAGLGRAHHEPSGPATARVLEPGMTFHLIPAIWKEDWGIEITESFLVTGAAPRPLQFFPRLFRRALGRIAIATPSPVGPKTVGFDRDGERHGFLPPAWLGANDSGLGRNGRFRDALVGNRAPARRARALSRGRTHGGGYERPVSLWEGAPTIWSQGGWRGASIMLPASISRVQAGKQTSPIDKATGAATPPSSPQQAQ